MHSDTDPLQAVTRAAPHGLPCGGAPSAPAGSPWGACLPVTERSQLPFPRSHLTP